MKLHTNPELFEYKLELISQKNNKALPVIKRDYWLTNILYKFSLHELSDKLIIKGGCALKYFYGLIDREIYDVDFVSVKPICAREIRFMFDDVMYASHFSTDEKHVLQHVRWFPYDHENLSQEIRMDYYQGETVFEHCNKTYVQRYLSEIFCDDEICEQYSIKHFSLSVMGINNIFVEKVLACSDKFIRQRYSEAKKHFADLVAIFKSDMLETDIVKEIFQKKIDHDMFLFGNDKIERILKFDVFQDEEFLKEYINDNYIVIHLIEYIKNFINEWS